MSSLFNLTGQYLALAHKLADLDFDADTVADTIEASGIVDDISEKCQAIEYVARGAESHNAMIDAEITRLQALKAHRAKTAHGLRDYIKRSMEALEIERIECPLFQISIRKNPPAVDIFDSLSLPEKFIVIPQVAPVIDKVAIAKTMKGYFDKDGKKHEPEDVPGARLTQSTRLAIS